MNPVVLRFAADARVLAPFTAIWLVLLLAAPASPAQRAAGDPLVLLVAVGNSPVICGLATLFFMVFWTRQVARLDGESSSAPPHSRAVPWLWAGAGVLVACAVAGALRLVVGSELPTFIPPEESSRPGLLLGMSAALIEETLFRMAIVPLVLALLGPRRIAGPVVAIAASALLFPLSHELPPDGVVHWGQVATRALFPGVVMTAAAIFIRPAFVLSAHCTAHLAIPFLFH